MSSITNSNTGTNESLSEETVTREPPLYKVILLNDHYTTMDFVVEVIKKIFHKSSAEATRIMLDVHKKGRGTVGLYPLDIAESKILQVKSMAYSANFPLECTLEKE